MPTVSAAASTVRPGIETFYRLVDRFLAEHTSHLGVDYASILENRQLLDSVVVWIAYTNADSLDESDRKAFLINTYNVLAIKSVVDEYPVASPLDVPGFFDKRTHDVGGVEMSLDSLEKRVIFGSYADARLHLALVCAARGCPPLHRTAFRGETLDAQLDAATRMALHKLHIIRLDPLKRIAYLSELFTWYRDDFVAESGTIGDFIRKYREPAIPEGYSTEMIPYNWELNEVK
jgi:hypothetical protein